MVSLPALLLLWPRPFVTMARASLNDCLPARLHGPSFMSMRISTHMSKHMPLHTCLYTCLHTCVHTHLYIYLYMFLYTRLRMCLYTCLYTGPSYLLTKSGVSWCAVAHLCRRRRWSVIAAVLLLGGPFTLGFGIVGMRHSRDQAQVRNNIDHRTSPTTCVAAWLRACWY